MRVYFTNLGCKLNQAELEQFGRQFLAAGHSVVGSLEEADLHVLNTCTVTHLAARDSRKTARRGKRINPQVRTVLTGCYAASERAEAEQLAGVDLVVSNVDKNRLLELVHRRFPETLPMPEASGAVPVPYVPLEFGNSRALVKVEDGCNMRCGFCIIPSTRGQQQSRPLTEVLQAVQGLAAAGYQEVVITGVQISSYRWQDQGLFELTRTLLEQTTIPRLRLTSIAPWQFDHRLLELFESRRLCRHVHLSLQSGCSATLQRMRRPYTSVQFADLVAELRQQVPSIAITTDVIVGFPGETDDEFQESLEFSRQMSFARLHAFPYSRRPSTAAAELPDQIPHEIKRQRMKQLLVVARDSKQRFERYHAHTPADVLWEFYRDGAWFGMTDNYLRVVTESAEDLAHRITTVRLAEPSEAGMTCALA